MNVTLPVWLAFALGVTALPAMAASQSVDDYVPGEVLIQFRAGTTEVVKAAVRRGVTSRHKDTVLHERRRNDKHGDLELNSLPRGITVADAVRMLQANPAVELAEPNWIYQHTATSNDTYYNNSALWGMYGANTSPANPNGSRAGEAWARGNTGSNSVLVGIIDEGIQIDHPELAANIWTNPYDPVDGIDNDGNGYIDDIHGWDFANNDNTVYDGATTIGSDSHGTHVAGTIGAVGGNGSGVAGVNWNVGIISAKFLGTSGGTLANAIKAINYITDLKKRHGLNVVATNNSWGGGGYSSTLLNAIVTAGKADIMFIAAAGNSGVNNDKKASYPASYTCATSTSFECIISVAAIDASGNKANFSNYGLKTVDLGAPGVSILSTVPNNSYANYSGTSMATPHVTGAAALYKASHPAATGLEIRNAILGNALPTPSLNRITVTGGRLNVSNF